MKQALQNWLFMVTPSAVYAFISWWRFRLSGSEIASRLGLRVGQKKGYLAGILGAMPAAMWGALASRGTSSFHGSMIAPFIGAKPALSVLGSICVYGVLATSAPEELLFRGLIAGALFRRLPFWKANVIQATIFLVPHLLILLVAPKLWFSVALIVPLGLFLGWLRQSSGSIGPCIIVHAASNLAGALAVLGWSTR
jgi:membrane protease YdiL (CAAX protease family)